MHQVSPENSPDETEIDGLQRRSRGALIGIVVLAVLVVVLIGFVVFGPASDSARDASSQTTAPREPAGGGIPEPKINFDAIDPVAAPEFSLTGFDGETITNSTFHGKPLVVNFWASWCGPCRAEMPAFNEVFNELDDKVGFLGVAWEDTEPAAREFAAEREIGYPLAMDTAGLGDELDFFGLPSTYLIDADGLIVDARFGELSKTQLLDLIAERFDVAVT